MGPIRIRGLLHSNPCPEIDWPDVLCGFPLSLQARPWQGCILPCSSEVHKHMTSLDCVCVGGGVLSQTRLNIRGNKAWCVECHELWHLRTSTATAPKIATTAPYPAHLRSLQLQLRAIAAYILLPEVCIAFLCSTRTHTEMLKQRFSLNIPCKYVKCRWLSAILFRLCCGAATGLNLLKPSGNFTYRQV
jgi:hypothetical protein